jgi:hypothetical protein
VKTIPLRKINLPVLEGVRVYFPPFKIQERPLTLFLAYSVCRNELSMPSVCFYFDSPSFSSSDFSSHTTLYKELDLLRLLSFGS